MSFWVIVGSIVLLVILFLAYKAMREWEVLDNARRARERSRERRRQGGR